MTCRFWGWLGLGLLLLSGCTLPRDESSSLLESLQHTTAANQRFWHDQDLWYSIRRDFALRYPWSQRHQVRQQIAWYLRDPRGLERRLASSGDYLYHIHNACQQHRVPGEIALLPMIESSFNPFAHSRMGAAGIWQMMPGTASGYGIKQTGAWDGRRDIFKSTDAALQHLTHLQRYFKGDWLLTLAAYNSGEGTVERAMRYNEQHGRSTDFWSLPLPLQTRIYVSRILALAELVRAPDQYALNLPVIKNEPHLTTVALQKTMNLQHAAQLAGMPLQQFYRYNPGFNGWTTGSTHRLVLPVQHAKTFQHNLRHQTQVQLARYHVRAGDTLSSIAHQHHTNISALQQANHINHHRIRVGQMLQLPPAIINHGKPHPHHTYTGAYRQIVHHVAKRDTLAKLAKRYNVTAYDIVFWNQIPTNRHLRQKKTIVIWQKRPPQAWLYTVKAGDSIIAIARRFHTTPQLLKATNRLNSNMIRVGLRLQLPPRHPIIEAL